MKINPSETGMIWQNIDTDKNVTPEMVVKWGIEHFEGKYKQPVILVSCHPSTDLKALHAAFPSVDFEYDYTIYTPTLYFMYGSQKPEVIKSES